MTHGDGQNTRYGVLKADGDGRTWSLAVIVAAFVAVNIAWIWRYRYAQAFDIDEAGYLGYAAVDYYGLLRGGLHGWTSAILAPSIQAPVTMAAASLLFIPFGPHPIVAFGVPLLAAAGCVAAAYALGRTIGSRPVGLLAAALTASCPIIVNYARSFHFSMPVTLVTTLALLAILRSRGFRSVGWALAFGVLLGLMPLTRTMTVAFVPGLALAAAAAALSDAADRARRLLLLAGSFAVALLAAATWLVPNGRMVAQYLLDFGYGSHAAEYGPQVSEFGAEAWQATAISLVQNIYLPHFMVLLCGFLALVAMAFGKALSAPVPVTLRHLRRSPLVPILLFAAEALTALTTSGNKGSAFLAPIVPALLAVSAWALWRVAPWRPVRAALATACAAACVMAALPLAWLDSPITREWVTPFPILGYVTVTDGRGNIQRYEANAGYGATGTSQPIDPAASRAWVQLSDWTSGHLAESAIFAFGFRHALYNVNTVNLLHALRTGHMLGARQVDPVTYPATIDGYQAWLHDDAQDACVLLTSDQERGDFVPLVDQVLMAEAARSSGFVPGETWPMPDGQVITLWRHRSSPPGCPGV